jgi:hypothetical protein
LQGRVPHASGGRVAELALQMFGQGRNVDIRHSVADGGQGILCEECFTNEIDAVLFVVPTHTDEEPGATALAADDDVQGPAGAPHRFGDVTWPLELQPQSSE